MGGWKERKGRWRGQREMARGRGCLSQGERAVWFTLAHSLAIQHPPPPPHLFEDSCACHGLWSPLPGHLSVHLRRVDVRGVECHVQRGTPVLKSTQRPKGATRASCRAKTHFYGSWGVKHSSLINSSTVHYEMVLISNAGRLLLLIISHPYPLTAFGASSVCFPSWLWIKSDSLHTANEHLSIWRW